MGRVTRARTTARPGNSVRASSHASGTPSTTAIPVAAQAPIRDRRRASVTTGSRSRPPRAPHGARWSRAANGRATKAIATTAGATRASGGRSPPPARRRRARAAEPVCRPRPLTRGPPRPSLAARRAEAVGPEDLLALRRQDEVDERLRRLGFAGPGQRGDRVLRHHVHVVGDSDAFHG